MRFSNRDHPAVIAAARHALADSAVAVDDAPVVLARGDVEGVRAFCRSDRISGLLAGAVRDEAIVIEHDADAGRGRRGIEDDWHDALHACVLLEALLIRVVSRLEEADVRSLVTKGSAVAHLDYPDPALRTFADVDLVVHPDDWDRAVALLAADAQPGPWHRRYIARYGKGLTVSTDGMEVDLHLRFAVGRFGLRCRTADLFRDQDSFALAGRRIATPTTAHRLVHACFHAALGGSSEMRAYRDVAQIGLGSPDDTEQAWAIAEEWGVRSVVAAAVIEAWVRLGLSRDHDLVRAAMQVPVTRADERSLRVFDQVPGFRRQAFTALTELPWRERSRFARTTWMMSRERRR